MNFFTAEITNRLRRRRHELSCSWLVWRRLVAGLRERGRGVRESGAFLLGSRKNGHARITGFVLYDDVDPHSLDTGIVHLDGRCFGALWDLCKQRGVTVVADVHTHPAGSGQSPSDQAHPIIARAGHIALIVPHFARAPVRRSDVGLYRYLGSRRWETIAPAKRRAFFRIGL
jgi:hypothetical protein